MIGVVAQPPDSAIAVVSTDAERWAAVVSRDSGADGTFYYSVRTTGVYCRPSCPSRRPHRHNVAFHDTTADAERAGYRPCKRCRPSASSLSDRNDAAVARACQLLDSAESEPSLTRIAEAVGLSSFHVHRIFRSVTGITPKAYAAARRADRVRNALSRRPTVTDAVYEAGFNSGGRFYANAVATLGMRPATYRAGGKGEVIRFAVSACSLGSILVASTDKGVCAVAIGDDADALLHDLERRFPNALLVGGDKSFETVVLQVVGLVERPSVGLNLPLDVRGTAFQQRVWQALRETTPGERVSYSAIAKRLGVPDSARAVARACAANPIAVAIPCHRVVRLDGTLSGYKWGIDRKRALLEREAS